MERQKPCWQQTYRQKKTKLGLTRIELQIDAKLKARFEQMVEDKADDYHEPYDERRRKAIARRELFEKGIMQQSVEYSAFEARIEALKAELAAVSPKFFKLSNDNSAKALPETIASLPDNTLQLKQLLTKEYQRAQQAETQMHEQKRRAAQYQALYEVANEYNERLQNKIGHSNELLGGDYDKDKLI